MVIQGTQQEKQVVGVAGKLFALMCDIHASGVIEKEGANQEQRYKYLTERQIKALIQPLLVKHRLLWLPLWQSITSTGLSPKGTQRLTDVLVRYRWMDPDSGEFIEGEFIGTGADSNDKGVYKALTGGGKQVMCNTFQIPSGDDPEKDKDGEERNRVNRRSDREQDPESTITPGQLNRIFSIARVANMPADRATQIIGNYGYESSKDIKVKDYEAICAEIRG
jgi:hypothetical protein